MHSSALQQLILAAGLLETAVAAPQGPIGGYGGYNPTGRCGNHYLEKFENVKVKEVYFEEWKMASGINCHSNNDAPCTLTKAFTYSKTTSFSIGIQLQAKVKLTPIWEVAPTISAGYTWSTTKGEATSSSQPCAKGDGIVCGLQFRPKTVKLTGDYYKVRDSTYGDCSKKHFDEAKFEIESAVILGDKTTDKGDEALVEFEACIMSCENDAACWKAHQSGNSLCPGVEKPKNWGKKPEANGGGGNGGNGGGKAGCDKEPGKQTGQCKPEHIGRWNCVKGESWQRCASGTWSGLTPLPAGAFCDCGYKSRDWDPSNPGTNPPDVDLLRAAIGSAVKIPLLFRPQA